MVDIITVLAIVMVIFVSGMVVGGRWMKRMMKKKYWHKIYKVKGDKNVNL